MSQNREAAEMMFGLSNSEDYGFPLHYIYPEIISNKHYASEKSNTSVWQQNLKS